MGVFSRTSGTGRRKLYRGALMASSVLALNLGGTLAQAQDRPSLQAEQRSFDIGPRSLIDALVLFGRQSGMQISVDAALIAGVSSSGVTGAMTAEQALARLLAGTGISYRLHGNTAMLEKNAAEGAMTLDPVTVEARQASTPEQGAQSPIRGYVATHALTATKTDTSILETPQTISVVARDQITDQNAQSLNQVLRYTSGVTTETRGAVATRYDQLTIRGFDGNTYLNGLKLPDLYYIAGQIDPYLLERVEALKGPTSVLYGQAPAGGIINQVSKRPTADARNEVGMELGTDNHFRTNMDFSGPLDKEGKYLYRFTATGLTEDGQIDTTENQRVAVAPAFTFQPDSDTRLTLLGLYQSDPKGNSYGSIPAGGTVLSNPYGQLPADFYDGDPNFEKFNRQQKALGAEFDKKLDDMWTLRMNARAMRTTMAYDSVYASSLGADNRTLSRGTASSREELDAYSTDNQLEVKLATGRLKHTVLGGFDYQYAQGHYDVGFGAAPSLDVFSPVYGMAITAPNLSRTSVEASQLGLYLQDQIRLGGWILTLGGRHDDSWRTTTTTSGSTDKDDSAWTGKAGLSYVFANGVAPYASYAESFTPVSGTDYAGKTFDPETGTQYEIGVKYQPPGEASLLSAALFDLTRNNTLTSDPVHNGFSIQTGQARSRGLELEARTALNAQWDVIGAYTYMDTKVVTDNSGNEGNRLPAVPRHQASAWVMYHLPNTTELKGLSLGGGVRYVGATTNPANTILVPSVTLADAAVTYALGALSESMEGTEVALNVKNLFDKRYVASCYYGEWCAYGYERTVTASVRYQW